MGCLAVLFALDQQAVERLNNVPRDERPEYIRSSLEEEYFQKYRHRLEELDKSWDAMHRVLTGGGLLYGNKPYPLSGVVLGGEVLYGNGREEVDYIITLTPPEWVRDIATALPALTEEGCRRRYFAIDEQDYGYPLSEEDFRYSWEYLQGSIPFWKSSAERGQAVLFTVDQ